MNKLFFVFVTSIVFSGTVFASENSACKKAAEKSALAQAKEREEKGSKLSIRVSEYDQLSDTYQISVSNGSNSTYWEVSTKLSGKKCIITKIELADSES